MGPWINNVHDKVYQRAAARAGAGLVGHNIHGSPECTHRPSRLLGNPGHYQRQQDLEQTPSHFFQWMGTNFTASATVAVRRQADNGSRAVSMRRLLEELKAYPDLFSRPYHISLYGPHFPAGYADGCYDKFVGKGRTGLDPTEIQKQIDLLISKTDAIKHYVDLL
jgi:hypothetical protein